jgi:hypothetical protein
LLLLLQDFDIPQKVGDQFLIAAVVVPADPEELVNEDKAVTVHNRFASQARVVWRQYRSANMKPFLYQFVKSCLLTSGKQPPLRVSPIPFGIAL